VINALLDPLYEGIVYVTTSMVDEGKVGGFKVGGFKVGGFIGHRYIHKHHVTPHA
jgi:hypothetical protein